MNGIARNVLRLSGLKNIVTSPKVSVNPVKTSRVFFNTLRPITASSNTSNLVSNTHRHPCACISCRFAHTKGKHSICLIKCINFNDF